MFLICARAIKKTWPCSFLVPWKSLLIIEGEQFPCSVDCTATICSASMSDIEFLLIETEWNNIPEQYWSVHRIARKKYISNALFWCIWSFFIWSAFRSSIALQYGFAVYCSQVTNDTVAQNYFVLDKSSVTELLGNFLVNFHIENLFLAGQRTIVIFYRWKQEEDP